MPSNPSLNEQDYARVAEPGTVSTGGFRPLETATSQGLSADSGAGMAHIIYLAFIGGFFVPLITLIAVILAYVHRDPQARFSPHFTFQIRTFWWGLTLQVITLMLYLALGARAALAGGSPVSLLLPIGLMLWWVLFTIGRITRGLRALNRGQAAII